MSRQRSRTSLIQERVVARNPPPLRDALSAAAARLHEVPILPNELWDIVAGYAVKSFGTTLNHTFMHLTPAVTHWFENQECVVIHSASKKGLCNIRGSCLLYATDMVFDPAHTASALRDAGCYVVDLVTEGPNWYIVVSL
jgi:hypothetical protein